MKTRSKLQLTLLFILLAPFTMFAQQTDSVKTDIKTITIDQVITKVKTDGPITLIIQQDNEQSISFDKSIAEFVEYKIKEGVLKITSNGGNSEKSKVLLKVKSIDEIKADDVSKIESMGVLKFPNLKIVSNDVSSVQLTVDVENLVTNSNDASKIVLKGKALNYTLTSDDASKTKAQLLEAINVKATTNDASAAWINGKETITGSTNDVSQLNYYDGAKTVNIESNDVSRAKKFTEMNLNDDSDVVISPLDTIKQVVTDILVQVDSTIIKDGNNNSKNKWHHGLFNKEHYDGNWAGIMLGFNNILDANGKIEVPVGYEYLDVDLTASRTFALNIFEQNFNLIGNKLGITTGIGFQWYNYNFAKNVTLFANQSVINGGFDTINASYYQKSKLAYTMLNIPLLLEFQTNPNHNKRSFHINAGVIFGVKLNSHTISMIDDGAERYTKVSDDFNLNPIRLDATASIGYGIINLFASYSLTPLFKDKEGPKMYPVTGGIYLLLW
jgi:hypothetical protein